MLRRTARLAVVTFLVTAASAVALISPASAAACSSAAGVTVVVDFHELGGGLQTVCDASGAGEYAGTQFTESGFTLTRVQRVPGFVCRVNGAPSEDPCVNTPPSDAYWGLWWSDGKSGSWSYASQGVDSLKVPEGGYVALSWNGSSTKSPPGATPTAHAADPSSGPSPSPTPTGGGSHPSTAPGAPQQSGTAGGATPSATASSEASEQPSAKAGNGAKRGRKHHAHRPSGTPSATSASGETPSASPVVSATSDPADPGNGGLPGWVAPVGVALLFAAAATTAAVRRRRGTTGP